MNITETTILKLVTQFHPYGNIQSSEHKHNTTIYSFLDVWDLAYKEGYVEVKKMMKEFGLPLEYYQRPESIAKLVNDGLIEIVQAA